jgi:hypothetical protein
VGIKAGTGEGRNEDARNFRRRQRHRKMPERSLARLDHRTKLRCCLVLRHADPRGAIRRHGTLSGAIGAE